MSRVHARQRESERAKERERERKTERERKSEREKRDRGKREREREREWEIERERQEREGEKERKQERKRERERERESFLRIRPSYIDGTSMEHRLLTRNFLINSLGHEQTQKITGRTGEEGGHVTHTPSASTFWHEVFGLCPV